jgi:hypothetical protein
MESSSSRDEEETVRGGRAYLGGAAVLCAGIAFAEAPAVVPPWGKGESPEQRAILEKTTVCTDRKSHFVVVAPEEQKGSQLYTGDGSRFVAVRPSQWGLAGTMFLDPRFVLKTANSNFRGADIRIHSEVEVDSQKKTCKVRCGDREIPLQILEPGKATPLLIAAKYEPNPQKYAPHALLRDDRGNYYYVERGIDPDNEKDFRLYVGPRGNMQLQKMTNIVADSEGEIFSTKKGELRMVVDRVQASVWIDKKQRYELRTLPVKDNMTLIYTDLGVYAGVRLGTPCDDL